MCICNRSDRCCCDPCYRECCCSKTIIRVLIFILFLGMLAISICSGLALKNINDRGWDDKDRPLVSALTFVIVTPVFWFLILIEQVWSCGGSKDCVGCWRFIMMCGIICWMVFTFISLFKNVNKECFDCTSNFPVDMIKSDLILMCVFGFPLLGWYIGTNMYLLCNSQYDFDKCRNSGTPASITYESGYYEITPQYSSYGTYIGTTRVWHN